MEPGELSLKIRVPIWVGGIEDIGLLRKTGITSFTTLARTALQRKEGMRD